MIPGRGYEVDVFRPLFGFEPRFRARLQDSLINGLRKALIAEGCSYRAALQFVSSHSRRGDLQDRAVVLGAGAKHLHSLDAEHFGHVRGTVL
jgi:hypothetical protein